jgi:hypothetical protein
MRMAHRSTRSVQVLFLAALFAVTLPAAAQWAWRDQNGRLVYSDQAPPASVKPAQIVRQPGGGAMAAPTAATSTPAPAGDAKGDATRGGPKTLAEQEIEFRKRQKERVEAEAKTQKEEALLAQKAAECDRQRGYLRSLEDGNRLFQTNQQGEREAVDDARRDAEIKRVRESLIKNCA